jgi:murein DD-endopeptidase MepM/ murein hydrolase activator NlpD
MKSVFLFFPFLFVASVGAVTSFLAKQGEVVVFPLEAVAVSPGKESAAFVTGTFLGKPVACLKTKAGWFAMIGIDFDQPTGTYPMEVDWGENAERRTYPIAVIAAPFGVQTLTLPDKQVDLDPATLQRVEAEKMRFTALWDAPVHVNGGVGDTRPRWIAPFIAPIAGQPGGTFGQRRMINGQPRHSHTGEDIAAPSGTPVAASNAGIVALVGDFFFNGHSVIIDHGAGLFTMYFHLLDVAVQPGATVARGDKIGRVGQSGRATGPHLHWGARLNGARVDPFSLLHLPALK